MSPGRAAAGHGSRWGGDSLGSVVFGGGTHVPVLNGGASRANSLAGARANNNPDMRAAGAPMMNQSMQRWNAEKVGDRKMKAPGRSVVDQYDAYIDASEEHRFNKLHAALGKMERKAEREHDMLNGAAGVSTEMRNSIADERFAGRRSRSPAQRHNVDASRFHAEQSVASLLRQPDPPTDRSYSAYSTAATYGGGDAMDSSRTSRSVSGFSDVDMSRASSARGYEPNYAAPLRRDSPRRGGASPRRENRAPSPRPAVPPINMEGAGGGGGYGNAPHGGGGGGGFRLDSSRRAASPRRAPSPRGPVRAQSPFRACPEARTTLSNTPSMATRCLDVARVRVFWVCAGARPPVDSIGPGMSL